MSGAEHALRSNNNRMSGGLPHSEIQGSKPITGSPWLIAGYHVLHRLLLPRHPPNALLALDLIQKKTGLFCTRPPFVNRPGIDQKHTFPLPFLEEGELCHPKVALVSVLDLDSNMLRG